MVSIQEQDVKNSRDKKLEIQIILEKLRQRDLMLFSLAEVEEEDDGNINKVLVSESVARVRKAIDIIKNAGIDTPVHPKYLCLDCGKIWISGVYHATSPGWVENVWSVA